MRFYIALLTVLVCAGQVFAAGERASLQVDLKDGSGNPVGSAEFREISRDNLVIVVKVKGLPPGKHGVSIREGSLCEAPDFRSVGALLNPRDHSKRASLNTGPITVDQDGAGEMQINSNLSITDRSRTVMGHTIVVDATEENKVRTHPGDFVEKLACGVIPNHL